MINGSTRLAGLLAHPAKHSLSPWIHNQSFQKRNINAVYLAFSIDLNQQKEVLTFMKDANWLGANLSMPNKQVGATLVDLLGDDISSLTKSINTIVVKDQHLIGYNTDGVGFYLSIPENYRKHLTKVTILGLGGAALSIIAYLASQGIQKIYIFNRTCPVDKARETILQMIEQKYAVEIQLYSLYDTIQLQLCIYDSELVVQATQIGMDGISNPIHSDICFSHDQLVMDLIYHPWQTPFLKQAAQSAKHCKNGFDMLLYQAAAAFELWTHQTMPVAYLKKRYIQDYLRKDL